MSVVPAQYEYRSLDRGHSHDYIMRPLRRMLGAPAGPILDLGCGSGWLAMSLMEDGYDVYGVDTSVSGIRLADTRAAGRFFLMNVEEETLPTALQDKPFNTAISTEVIEHLYEPRRLVRLARSVLQRHGGGRFIVSTPYHGYLKYLALAVAGRLDAHHTVLWDGGHIKFFSRRTLEALLTEEQFSVTGFAGAGRAPFLWKSMLISARV